MNDLPLVTIIINNYNYGRYIRDAIDSALHQSYDSVEVIVVDDGSTDNSHEIIRCYGEKIIPILKENGGQASAFNSGLAASRGEVIIFLDSDDVLLPTIAQRVVDTMRGEADVAKVQYRMEVIDAAGRRSGVLKPHRHLPMRSGDLKQHILSFPDDMTWAATSGNAFAASVLHKIFPIPERAYGRFNADWYLSHITLLFGSLVSLDEVGALYRVHGSNNYELSAPTIDLDHIRESIRCASVTHEYIVKFADQLGLAARPKTADDLLSVSFVANRIMSLKFDPERHPIKHDSLRGLLLIGITATFRRFDVSLAMKLLFLSWFVAMVVTPKLVAQWLAVKLLFPETRGSFNKVVGVFYVRS